jgi:hypothetical protein
LHEQKLPAVCRKVNLLPSSIARLDATIAGPLAVPGVFTKSNRSELMSRIRPTKNRATAVAGNRGIRGQFA